jgi:NitT/TauT family transport system ATP-binding protein
MKQRVALARALAMEPPVLLIDEPFGALDQQTRQFIGRELLRIWEKTRNRVLFITHDIQEAVYLSDEVWVMSARPSVVKEVVRIDLPRPRPEGTHSLPRFRELEDHLWALVKVEAEKTLGPGAQLA